MLTEDNFDTFLEENDNVFVEFYVTWCSFSAGVAPTWEEFGNTVVQQGLDMRVAKVDCTAQADFCHKSSKTRVMAFPTMRWFKNGQRMSPDYRMGRTLESFLDYSKEQLDGRFS